MKIASFLRRLYTGHSGHLSIWDLQTSTTKYFDLSSPWVFEEAETYALDRAAKEYDVYFGVGTRKESLPPSQRGKKSHVLSLPALWLDVDIAGPGHKSKKLKLPETLEQAVAIVEKFPLPPSIIVHSGGGIHCYWLLDEPLVVGRETELYNAVWKNFQRFFISAAAADGFHVDQTGNIDRVLRLPDTGNFKAKPMRPVEEILSDDVRYSFLRLAERAGPYKPIIPKAGIGDESVVETVKQRLTKLANAENREIMAKVLRGEPFAEAGERDTTLQRAAGCVAFVLSSTEAATASAEALSTLFEKSIAAMAEIEDDPENPALTMDDVVDKISRALDDRARTAEEDEKIKQAFGIGVSTETSEEEKSRTEAFIENELRDYARRQKCSPEEFMKRWIIQHGASYYVFVDGKYKAPVPRESLLTHLKEDFRRVPDRLVSLQTFTVKGALRAKTMPEVLKDYATGARVLKGSFVLEESVFDAATETFCEAVCPVRVKEPIYNEKIDHWLRLLGGPEADKLLDWIATVLRLDLQSSALYLNGAAAAGKTMLADGLARLWNTSGPSKMEDVADTNFNGDISRCPLVFADEQVKCSTAELRRLVGSSSHKLKRKFLANVDIEGALRIIMADNSGRLITGDGLAEADLEAVASKFLNVVVDAQPVQFLRDIGGRNKGTDGWVDGDMIAAHAIWLGLNRDVVLGNRLAVEGSLSKMAQLLVTQDRITATICEWIAGYALKPSKAVKQHNGVVIGGGKILVAAESISKNWGSHILSEKSPFSIGKIGRALGSLSHERLKFDGKRYHSVKPELIYAWADAHLSCDIDDLKRKVNRGLGEN